jgi:phospholipase C
MSVNRRDFLRGVGLTGAASAASLVGKSSLVAHRMLPLPDPSASGIEHIVVVMMENRSFDHLLGWLPGANGRQAGLAYLDNEGEAVATSRLTTFVGCSHPDPDHSYTGGRSEYDDGKMDGWLRTTTNDVFSIGYYEEADLPFFSALARNYTTLDNYFASILGPTFPNRIFQHAAQTDRTSNTIEPQVLLLERTLPGPVGTEVPGDLRNVLGFSCRCGRGHPAFRLISRSALHDPR